MSCHTEMIDIRAHKLLHLSSGLLGRKPRSEEMGIQSTKIMGQLIGIIWAFLVAQVVKILSAMRETWVRSLGQEDKPWKRKWQPTPVFLPGEFHGQRSLVGCLLWGHTELDMTKPT